MENKRNRSWRWRWPNKEGQAVPGGLLAGAAGIVVLVAGLGWWVLQPAWQVLFSGLSPRDSAAIAAELDRLKLPWRLDQDGQAILMDEGQVHKTRMQLMGKGVPLQGSVGFELFDDTGFGMSDFAQRINYQRALQGELARTIGSMQEVQSARVHLVIPENGLLRANPQTPKASVTVIAREGKQISPEQVQGIQRLVAAAVPDMTEPAVAVLDARGVPLSRGPAGEQQSAVEGRVLLKQQSETYLAGKLQRILERTFGVGEASAIVDVTLNLDNLKVTREEVLPASSRNGDPQGAVARRRLATRRQPGNTETSAGRSGAAAAPADDEQQNMEVEYLHGRRVEQLVSAPGAITRISVAVVIPGPLEADRHATLSRLLESAAGLDPERGDLLVIYQREPAPGTAAGSVDSHTTTRAAQQARSDSQAAMARAPASHPALAHWPWLAALAALSFGALTLVAARRRASALPRRLTAAERQQILARLQTWLAMPPSLPGKGDR